MTPNKCQDVLTSELCRVVLSKLADLACSEGHSLKAVGVSERQITQLSQLSQRDIYQLTVLHQGVFDVSTIVETLLSEPKIQFPKEWKTFLLYGASNEMMAHYYKARPEDCYLCRSQLPSEQVKKGRSISDKQHAEVVKALNAEGGNRQISAERLLHIAKTHQVSLCALWNELKKWEKE